MNAQSLIEELRQGEMTLDVMGQKKHAIVEQGAAALDPLLVALEGKSLSSEAVGGMLRDILRRLGPEEQVRVAPVLEQRLDPGAGAHVLRLVMRLMEEGFCLSLYGSELLFKIAMDRTQQTPLRCQALATLAGAPIRPGGCDRFLELLADPDTDVVLAVLGALERQAVQVDSARAEQKLWHVGLSREGVVRQRSIELLGTFGEIHMLERACLLPTPQPADIQAVQEMVRRLLARPRNLYRLRPENFEHMIHQLLMKMNFQGVEVTGRPGDGGVDLRAHRDEEDEGGRKQRRHYIVQCKRHSTAIGPEEVLRFIDETLSKHQDVDGLFVTTAVFTAAAREARGSHRLKLWDREELQGHLDRHLGSGIYCVRL